MAFYGGVRGREKESYTRNTNAMCAMNSNHSISPCILYFPTMFSKKESRIDLDALLDIISPFSTQVISYSTQSPSGTYSQRR